MPRKAVSKYTIDRRRTRGKVEGSAVEHENSDSDISAPNDDDEECNTEDIEHDEDDDDEYEYDEEKGRRKRQRQPKRRACTLDRKWKEIQKDSRGGDGDGDDNSNVEEISDQDDEDTYVPLDGRSTQSVARVTRNTGRSKAMTKGSDSVDDESDFGISKEKRRTTAQNRGGVRRSTRVYSKKQPITTRRRATPTKSPALSDNDDDEYDDDYDSIADEERKIDDEEEEKTGEEKNHSSQKNAKLIARNTSRITRSSSNRSNRLLYARRRQSQWGEGSGGLLSILPSPPSISKRHSAVEAKRKLMKMTKGETKIDDGGDDDGREPAEGSSVNEVDSYYDDEEEKEIDELPQKASKDIPHRYRDPSKTKKRKRKKAVHSSDEEFMLDSDDDGEDSSPDHSLSDDANAELTEDDNDILMIGDPDLSDNDSDHNDIVKKEKGNKQATDVVNIDNENFGNIDEEDNEDDQCNDERFQNRSRSVGKHEILPSPHGVENTFQSDGDPSDEDTTEAKSKITARLRRQAKCPKCSSTEDAITVEPLPRLHVCYIAPDGKSRQCFNLETLRQIALKSSQLELRVDIDGERQNFLQPPAFRTAMSDDLVDQIASKFGRGALDLHGAYYKNRGTKYDNKEDEYAYDSNSNSDENIYDSFTVFRERVKDYFKKGMGSQDIYVCPLCYGKIHRNIANPDDSYSDDDAEKEYDAAPSDSIYDPIMVLGHLDNDEMSISSQFCFKKLADVKNHLRQEHNVDTRGIQGNELYKRFRVRAPDGLLQRWLSTQVRGQVKQGHMRMYWGQGNDQIYIQLLDLVERAKVYGEGSLQKDDESSEEDGACDEWDESVSKARRFFDTFATKASDLWKIISSPFLKSNENLNDFIAKDDDCIEEKDPDEQPHAILHQQFMNSINEDSDENDLVHKLQRKYAETNDEESYTKSSSTEEELEFVDGDKESDDEDDDKDIYNRNGYYSPIDEEKDEWVLKLQSQRKRKLSKLNKQESVKTTIETPVGKTLFRRKTTPRSSTPGTSKKKRKLTIEDSSEDESF